MRNHSPAADSARSRVRRRGAAALLVIAVLAAFGACLGNGFVEFDDDVYVTANPMVRSGLTGESVRWAFTTTAAANWHPLTWLSHLADVSLHGMDPRGHHLTSLLLHALNALLLLRLGRALTGSPALALAAAALFALHPLRVESVAWVAERKDVLAAFWFLAGLLCYVAYARRGGALRYAAVVACHALALLSKPMAVTFPVVLLLLDWWPLGRLGSAPGSGRPDQSGTLRRILLEKLPLLLLSLAAALATLRVQSQVAAEVAKRYALSERLGNAAVSLFQYWGKTLAPVRLAYFYPHPGAGLSWLAVGGALAGLALATGIAWRCRSRAPWLAFGWGWFLVAILPVIGIVQVGAAALADRYTYLPFIGPVLGLGAALVAVARRSPRAAPALAAGCVAAALTLGYLSHRQTAVWRDGWTLATHAVEVTRGNWIALSDVGLALTRRGLHEPAIARLRESIRHQPSWHGSRYNLALALTETGRYAEAVEEYDAALRLAPEYWPAARDKADALNRWGISLIEAGKAAEALGRFDQAIATSPGSADYRFNRGLLLLRSSLIAEAAAELRRVVALAPGHAQGHQTLGEALERSGDAGGAARHYREALRLDPTLAGARRRLRALEEGGAALP